MRTGTMVMLLNAEEIYRRSVDRVAEKALSANQTLDDALLGPRRRAGRHAAQRSDLTVARAPCAVPVVCEEHNYLGIISKAMLLQALDRRAPPMSDTTQTQDPRATAPVDAGAAPANDATANAGDARPARRRRAAAAAPRRLAQRRPAQPEHFSLLDPFHKARVPFDAGYARHRLAGAALPPAVPGYPRAGGHDPERLPAMLLGMPAPIAILVFSLLARQIAGLGMGAATLLSTSPSAPSVLVAGDGHAGAGADRAVLLHSYRPAARHLAGTQQACRQVIRPLLDAMQTTPAFVYLVPIVMLFGIGNVPGVVVTIIFALPPIVRLTILGIKQVPEDLIEAAESLRRQPASAAVQVQLPLAMPTIMAGVNQTLMLALSMVVIASMIAVGGLGQMVLRGIGRLDMGTAAVGGVGIVITAIILDRLTQSLGRDRRSKAHRPLVSPRPHRTADSPVHQTSLTLFPPAAGPRRATPPHRKRETLCALWASGLSP